MVLPAWSTTLIGSIAAICTTGAFVPQVLRVWRLKSAGEISLTTFLVFSVGTVAWLSYGLLIRSVPVIFANGATLVLSLTMVSLKLNYDRSSRHSVAKGPLVPSR
jgi:MtN3 and saliva related transmembrane protein